MKRILISMCVLMVSGCVSVSFQETVENSKFVARIKESSLTDIHKLKMGMKIQEVKAIMQAGVKIGYEKTGSDKQDFRRISLKNPYRIEEMKKQNRQYKVYYYFTHIVKSDGIISDEELTPIVFEYDTLIGKGWNYLFRLKNR
jgi:hypothetical protein